MKKTPLLLLLVVVSMHSAWAQPHNNPVFTGADPHAIMIGKEYWVYPTNAVDTGAHKRADRFYAYASTDLQQWTNRGELITMNDINWIRDDGAANHSLWAPALLHYKKKYYVGKKMWKDPAGGTRKVAVEAISYDNNGLIVPVQMTDSISGF